MNLCNSITNSSRTMCFELLLFLVPAFLFNRIVWFDIRRQLLIYEQRKNIRSLPYVLAFR